jgi:hypothetical protein
MDEGVTAIPAPPVASAKALEVMRNNMMARQTDPQ